MNIRNLLLTSIIFCATSVVCVASKPTIIAKTQEFLLVHMKFIKILSPQAQQLMKKIVSGQKTLVELLLKEMHIGRSTSEFKHEVLDKCNTVQAPILYAEFNTLIEDKLSTDEKNIVRTMHDTLMLYLTSIQYPGTLLEDTITQRDIAKAQEAINHLSLILKNLNNTPALPNSKISLTEKIKKLLNCSELIKILRPEVQELIKNRLTFNKKLFENDFNAMHIGQRYHTVAQKTVEENLRLREESEREFIEICKKIQITVDEEYVVSAIEEISDLYILISRNLMLLRDDGIISHKDIADTKKIIEHLSYVLECI